MQIFKLELSTEFGYKPNYKFSPTSKKYIPYGEDNMLDLHLSKLSQTSPTHASLLKLEQNLTFGGGFLYDKSNTALDDFIQNNNLNEVLDRCSHDFVKYGGFYLQIIWSKDGKTIAGIEHQDFSQVRINNELVSEPKSFWLCFDWCDERKYGSTEIPAYNPLLSKSQPNQLLYIREYNSFTKFYPKVPYNITYCCLESELATLNLSGVKNGLTSSGMFVFKEVLDPEERKALKNNIKRDFTGAEANGKFIAVFAQSKETAPEFIPIQTDNNSDMYNALNDITVQKILTSHRLSSPALAGLPGGGSIFTNEISTGFEYYQSLVIKDIQQPILRAFNKLFKYNNLLNENEVVDIKQINPIQFKASENVLMATMTINEIRTKMLGLDLIEGGDVIVHPNSEPITPSPTTTPTNDITSTPNEFK